VQNRVENDETRAIKKTLFKIPILCHNHFMNSVLQNSIAQLSTNEQLELAQWIIGNVQAHHESSIPDLTPLELRQALQRAANNPQAGKTPEQSFETINSNRKALNTRTKAKDTGFITLEEYRAKRKARNS
jgi:hypothetical protein